MQYSTEAECRDMIQIEFSKEEIQQLNYERYHLHYLFSAKRGKNCQSPAS